MLRRPPRSKLYCTVLAFLSSCPRLKLLIQSLSMRSLLCNNCVSIIHSLNKTHKCYRPFCVFQTISNHFQLSQSWINIGCVKRHKQISVILIYCGASHKPRICQGIQGLASSLGHNNSHLFWNLNREKSLLCLWKVFVHRIYSQFSIPNHNHWITTFMIKTFVLESHVLVWLLL